MLEANLSYVARSVASNIAADVTQPRTRKFKFFRDWVRTNYRYFVYRPNLPQISIPDLFQDQDMPFIDIHYRYSSMTLPPLELYVLGLLLQKFRPKTIFEFGTYKGGTTLHIAKCSPDSQITTIDYDPGQSADNKVHYNEDTGFGRIFTPGQHFHGLPEHDRITQVYGDTLKYDFTDHYGKYDFIFIDAEHEYIPGMSDSLNSFKMLKPQGGVIVWDDYSTWPGLKQAVEELSANNPIYHIENTRLAYMRV